MKHMHNFKRHRQKCKDLARLRLKLLRLTKAEVSVHIFTMPEQCSSTREVCRKVRHQGN